MNAPTRTCGTCSMCCKAMWIEDLQKPAGTWCQHARPGQGCSIYDSRPAICRSFVCQWLVQPGMPEELKPSRSKVVLAAVQGSREGQLIAYCDPADPGAWRRNPMHAFLKRQTGGRDGRPVRPVLVRIGARTWLMTPDADHDLGEAKGRKTFRLEPGPDGRTVARLVDEPEDAPRTPPG